MNRFVETIEDVIANDQTTCASIKPEEFVALKELIAGIKVKLSLVNDTLDCAESSSSSTPAVGATPRPVIHPSDINMDTSEFPSGPNTVLKVKPMELMSFNGDFRRWRPFWEQFRTMIHSKNILPTEKFAYLLSVTSHAAKKFLYGYSLDSYETALREMTDHFGDPKKLVQLYYEELEKLAPAQAASDERANLDAVRKIVTNLESVGTMVDQAMVRRKILGKFTDTTLQFTLRELMKLPSEYNLADVMAELSRQIRVSEDVQMFNWKPSTSSSSSSSSNHSSYSSSTNNLKRKMTSTPASLVSGKSINNKEVTNCMFCANTHKSQDCKKFATLASRKGRITAKKLCFSCGVSGHSIRDCSTKDEECVYCKKTGHSIFMCVPYMIKNNPKKQKLDRSGTFLQTFVAQCNAVNIRGLIDSGSRDSYIEKSLVGQFHLKPKSYENCYVCPFGSREPICFRSGQVNLKLSNGDGKFSRNLNFRSTPHITGNIETAPSLENTFSILPENRKYADPNIFLPESERKPIQILIGSDNQYDILLSQTQRLNSGVVLVNSIFGWIPSGKITDSANYNDLPSSAMLSADPMSPHEPFDPSILSNLWNLECLGIKASELENIDDKVIENFRSTVRFENGRYVVRWPWKSENPNLPSNFRMCLARLKSLFQRSSLEVLTACDKLIKEQFELGIIEEAPNKTPYLTHYLPHRPVFRNGKIREVYDGSAKTKTGHSLNDMLHSGPALQENLVGLLLNFRINAIAISADIEKAFLQLALNEVDRDAVRWLWPRDITKPVDIKNLKYIRFARVPFGVISSPFLLNIVIQEHLSSPPLNVWNLAAKSKFYVDNLVISVDNVSSAVDLYDSLTKKFKTGGFRLRDWTSNNEEFLKTIPPSELSTSTNEIMSILGVNWNRINDSLSIKIDTKDPSSFITKRSVLSFAASIYDPLGLFLPCVLHLKLFIQECWKDKFAWDSSLPANLVAKWSKLFSEAQEIPKVTIPRKFWPFDGEGNITLHVFCDASKNAYACAAYICYQNRMSGQKYSTLVYSRVRIAPVKSKENLSIPRLELLAVLIGKRVSIFLTSLLDLQIDSIYLWTDATTVLQWLNSASLLPKFVQNRINEIRQTPNRTLRYVPTSDNPADIATRGTKASTLEKHDLWWHGPSWLLHERLWPATPENTEIIKTASVVLLTGPSSYPGILTDSLERKLVSWDILVRFFLAIISFLFTLSAPLSNAEKLERAEKTLVKEIQKKYFSSELNQLQSGIQPNYQLDLFLDTSGLIRCRGRLQNVSFPWDTIHPILLPRESPAVEAYIRKIHEENFHIGCSHLLAKIREKYWIIKGRAKVKSVIHKCIACRMVTGGSYRLPPMPPLPLVRVSEVSPFLHTGVDLLGPLYVEEGKTDNEAKVYVALFVCLVTRAVHLELVRNLSGDEFLLSLTRFIARRGVPKIIISDNARNFIGAQPLVGEKVTSLNEHIDRFSSANNIVWKFIPAYAPWHGGAYERLVAVVKSCIRKTFREVLLSYVELCTALCQIENIINGRPLTYVGEELLTPLTPNHFLRLRMVNVDGDLNLPTTPIPSTSQNLIRGWVHINGVTQNFWNVFRSHYLLALREKHNALHPRPRNSLAFSPSLGDLVLVKEREAPRAQWKHGVLVALNARQSFGDVRCSDGEILRDISINHLFPLELSS